MLGGTLSSEGSAWPCGSSLPHDRPVPARTQWSEFMTQFVEPINTIIGELKRAMQTGDPRPLPEAIAAAKCRIFQEALRRGLCREDQTPPGVPSTSLQFTELA